MRTSNFTDHSLQAAVPCTDFRNRLVRRRAAGVGIPSDQPFPVVNHAG